MLMATINFDGAAHLLIIPLSSGIVGFHLTVGLQTLKLLQQMTQEIFMQEILEINAFRSLMQMAIILRHLVERVKMSSLILRVWTFQVMGRYILWTSLERLSKNGNINQTYRSNFQSLLYYLEIVCAPQKIQSDQQKYFLALKKKVYLTANDEMIGLNALIHKIV